MTSVSIEACRTARDAAKSALKYFKDVKAVRSTNNLFDRTTPTENNTLKAYRNQVNNNGYHSMAQAVEDASHYGIGNCFEKGAIVYSSLKSNPLLVKAGLKVSYCCCLKSDGFDHVFCIVNSTPITGDRSAGTGAVMLKNLDSSVMIVDGWTQDWSFPMLPWTTAKMHGLSNIPNPRQLMVRQKISSHKIYNNERPDVSWRGILSRQGSSTDHF